MVRDGCSYFSFWAIFWPFTAWKIKIFKKWKKRQEISSFYICVPKLWSDDVQLLWYGARQTDGQTDGPKKWHIEVGAPSNKKIKAGGSRPGVLYGLCKVHKAIVDVLPPFRHTLSAIGTPTYKITRLLMNSLLKTLFRLQKKLSNKIVAFIWVA